MIPATGTEATRHKPSYHWLVVHDIWDSVVAVALPHVDHDNVDVAGGWLGGLLGVLIGIGARFTMGLRFRSCPTCVDVLSTAFVLMVGMLASDFGGGF